MHCLHASISKFIKFQLKIIHGILPPQQTLFHAGLADHDKCPLCNLETQSLTRMLFKSMTFWIHYTCWWQKTFHECINLTKSVILYGSHQDRDSNNYLNYCLVIAKYHIFTSNISVGILDFESFILRLKDKLLTFL